MIGLFAEQEGESSRKKLAAPMALLSQQTDLAAIAQTGISQLSLGNNRRSNRPV